MHKSIKHADQCLKVETKTLQNTITYATNKLCYKLYNTHLRSTPTSYTKDNKNTAKVK